MSKLFGTDGIRGRAGVPPLDGASVRIVGEAVASVLAQHAPAPRIVVGRDTRESGSWLLRDLAAGLGAGGARVRSAGVVPTPAVSLLARSDEFDAGIVISASHNPHGDNGLKVFGHDGRKLPDSLEETVERRVADARAGSASGKGASGDAAPADEPELRGAHPLWLLEWGRARSLDLSGMRLVVDSANGAGSGLAADLLSELGARVQPIHDAPDGRNINERCGALHLDSLKQAVLTDRAELGIALDGDADRALFVDGDGAVVDGDHVLLIAADALSARGELHGGGVVGTILSNFGLERALAERELELERAAVGDRNVLALMTSGGFNLGGEPSGHVVFLDDSPAGDGLLTALHVLDAMRLSGRSLSDLAAGLVRTPQVQRHVVVRHKPPLDDVSGLQELLQGWRERLAGTGRIVVRYSGTESLARVMVEATDETLVQSCAESLLERLQQELG